MKIILDFQSGICTVTKEAGDPKCYGSKNAAGESCLLYHIKVALNKRGFDLIKKRMWKDGHLVDDMQQYLRSRSKSSPTNICIYNSHWALRGAEEDFNKEGKTELALVKAMFKS